MKTFRRICSALLCCAMLFSLCACGKTEENESSLPTGPVTDENGEVFVAEYTKIDSEGYIYPNLFTEDGFYTFVSEVIGQRELGEGEVLEYEGQLDIWGENLYFVDAEGKLTHCEGYSAYVPTTENADKPEYNSGSYSTALFALPGGGFGQLVTCYENWCDAPDNVEKYSELYYEYYQYRNSYVMRTLDKDGTELSAVPMEMPVGYDADNFYIYSAVVSGDTMLLTYEQSIFLYDLEGHYLERIDTDNYVDSIFVDLNGNCYLKVWTETVGLQKIDLETRSFGEMISLPHNAYDPIPGSGKYDLFYSDYSSLYGYSFATEESEKLLSWVDVDINGDNISAQNIRVHEDGSLLTVDMEYNQKEEHHDCYMVNLVKRPASEVPQKTVLTLACTYLDWDMREAIINYNRASENVRIKVIDYSEYNTEEDYTAGLTKLNAELLAGTTPDMLCLNNLNVQQLGNKGLLTDLYTLIDKDSELNREDYFENLLGLFEVNGKLVGTVSGVTLYTLVGAKRAVGDRTSWNYADLLEALAGMPEGCTILNEYTTRDDILATCLGMDMELYVDWESGKCSFDSDGFKELLQFAATFPSEYDWENYDYNGDSGDRLKNGQQMLATAYIYSLLDVMQYAANFGTEVSFVGYPTIGGTGTMANVPSSYAICEKSTHKDEAWAFLRTLMTAEYQERQYYLPSLRSLYDSMEKEAMTPEYRKDFEGNYLLDENGERIPVPKYSIWTGMDEEPLDIYALSAEDAAVLREMMTTVSKLAYANNDLTRVVLEQAVAFFAGQKTVDEVAKLVQSKVTILVNEQR